MPSTRTGLTAFGLALATGALVATGISPAAATPADTTGITTGCASLASNANGRATIKNICNYQIRATVSVDWAWDPACITINAGRTLSISWNPADGRAEYAYEC
ncbi:hypothetical protein ACIRRH_40195 [Kitasatospora sp. NPDC101235]|uniref:hypothetical protein n=1 Tax=Kitasatospora sp. NPDC101235 TaxID=3364101 RepID=UPI00380DF105